MLFWTYVHVFSPLYHTFGCGYLSNTTLRKPAIHRYLFLWCFVLNCAHAPLQHVLLMPSCNESENKWLWREASSVKLNAANDINVWSCDNWIVYKCRHSKLRLSIYHIFYSAPRWRFLAETDTLTLRGHASQIWRFVREVRYWIFYLGLVIHLEYYAYFAINTTLRSYLISESM